jgi:hypothetical protein
MARKQVLKAETCHEVAPLGGNSPIVIRAVTKKVETLGLLLPAPRFHIAYPEIPSSGHFITYVVEMMLLNKFQNLRWRQNLAPQIEFLDGRFGCIHGAHSHLSKTQRPAGQWNGRKKMLEMSKHARFIEIADPDAGIGSIGHSDIIQGSDAGPKRWEPQVVGQFETKLPDPSRKTWNGSASTKPLVPARFAFVEAARLLGRHPSSRAKTKLTHSRATDSSLCVRLKCEERF